MPIQILNVKYSHLGEPDLFEPTAVCDVCGEIIRDHDGNVLYDYDYKVNTQRMTPVFVHRGQCDRLHERGHGRRMWMPIEQFIACLTHNINRKANEDKNGKPYSINDD